MLPLAREESSGDTVGEEEDLYPDIAENTVNSEYYDSEAGATHKPTPPLDVKTLNTMRCGVVGKGVQDPYEEYLETAAASNVYQRLAPPLPEPYRVLNRQEAARRSKKIKQSPPKQETQPGL